MRSALALQAWLRYTEAPAAASGRRRAAMWVEPPQKPFQPPTPVDPAKKPSSAMGWAWIITGIVGIALLLAISLFIGGLGQFQ